MYGTTAAKPAFAASASEEQIAVEDGVGRRLPGPCHQLAGSLLGKLLSASKHCW